MSARLAITAGEPAGIGPDLCIQIAQEVRHCELVVIADPQLLEQRARELELPLTIRLFSDAEPLCIDEPGTLCVCPVELQAPVTAGELNVANSHYVLETLRVAVQGALDKRWQGIVTAPVHKGIINDAGIHFSGHTEYFRDYCGVEEVVMMLATSDLRVALVTTHLPLRDVADAITADRIKRVTRILDHDLKTFFGIAAPHILVAGLNPHAGEDGHLRVGRQLGEVVVRHREELARQIVL